MILRVLTFVLYFFVSGFSGKLCVILLEPFFSVFMKQSPETENIILYIISVVVMFAEISFFSAREGHNDTGLLRFSYVRTSISYIISGVIFYSLILCTVFFKNNYIYYEHEKIFTTITEYFFFPFFAPGELGYMINGIAFFPGVPVLYNITENIKSFLLNQWVNPGLSVSLGVILCVIFYKKGRKNWIAQKKKKIGQAKQPGR